MGIMQKEDSDWVTKCVEHEVEGVRQCCQPCVFPATLGLFWCSLAGFFRQLRVAYFWACFDHSRVFGLILCFPSLFRNYGQ